MRDRGPGVAEVVVAELRDERDRRRLALAHGVEPADITEGAVVWARNGFVCEVETEGEALTSNAEWSLEPSGDPDDPETGVRPADVVGRWQRVLMARFLLWVETRLSGRGSRHRSRNAALICGPRGAGKTHLTLALRNGLFKRHPGEVVARGVTAADMYDPYVGRTEANFRRFFGYLDEEPLKGRIALGVIEEIDTAAGDRRGTMRLESGVERRVVGSLLGLLDGLHKLHPNVLLVFTSNLPRDGIDFALKRRLQVFDVPRLRLDELHALLRGCVEREPELFGGEPWQTFDGAVRAALETPVGVVRCGTDDLTVLACHALSGGAARAAFERAAENYELRDVAGLGAPLTPDELALEVVREAATVLSKMSLAEAQEELTGSGLIPEEKAGEIKTPRVTWTTEASGALDLESLADLVLERWS